MMESDRCRDIRPWLPEVALGTLDATEEEIFRFGRAVDASSELQMALTDPALSAATKAGIVDSLLEGRSTAATRQVLAYSVGHLHGQRLDAVIDEVSNTKFDC